MDECRNSQNPFQIFETLGRIAGEIHEFSENPTLEQLGVIDDNLLTPRDREFLTRLMAEAINDPDILRRVYEIRKKLNGRKLFVLDQVEASELLEKLKCKSFYHTDLMVGDCSFKEIDLEDAVVGGRLVFENVTTGKNNQRNMVIGKDNCQSRMIIKGDNDQSGMQVGSNHQEEVEIGGTNYQNGMRVNGANWLNPKKETRKGSNWQKSMKIKKNEQKGVRIWGDNRQSDISIAGDNRQEMEIYGQNWQEHIVVGESNKQELIIGDKNNQEIQVGGDNDQVLWVLGNSEQDIKAARNRQIMYVGANNYQRIQVIGFNDQAVITVWQIDPNNTDPIKIMDSRTINGKVIETAWTAACRQTEAKRKLGIPEGTKTLS